MGERRGSFFQFPRSILWGFFSTCPLFRHATVLSGITALFLESDAAYQVREARILLDILAYGPEACE